MKTNDELNVLKDGAEAANKNFNALTDEALEQVRGGAQPGSIATGSPISLHGAYYSTSYAEGGKNTKAIGWSDLTLGRVISGRAAPCEIKHLGVAIGWTTWDAISAL